MSKTPTDLRRLTPPPVDDRTIERGIAFAVESQGEIHWELDGRDVTLKMDKRNGATVLATLWDDETGKQVRTVAIMAGAVAR